MRNVVKVLAAGMLVVCLSVGLTFGADGTGTVVPTFTAKALQKVVAPGGTVTVEIRIANVSDLAVFQFAMKSSGGNVGSLTVEDIVINKQHPDFAFGTSQVMDAIDRTQMRAGGIQMTGGQDIVDPAYLATVTLRVSDDASGTFQINLKKGQETFLRDSNAVPIAVAIGDATTVTVTNRARPSRIERKKRQ